MLLQVFIAVLPIAGIITLLRGMHLEGKSKKKADKERGKLMVRVGFAMIVGYMVMLLIVNAAN
jgi:hypothetical protein